MTTPSLRSHLLWGALLIACGDSKDPMGNTSPGSATDTTDASGGTTGAATEAGTTGAPTTGATSTGAQESTGTTGCSFLECGGSSSGGQSTKECDQWTQDCPDGEKCMPYSGDGDNSWESLKCVPVVPNPGSPGDACTVEGSAVSGIDSCDVWSMCWNVDPNTQMGVCVAMCVGDPNSPKCEAPMTTCLVSNDGVLTLCLPQCDPLTQDCPGADLCIPNPQDNNAFLCILDASGDAGVAFDPCEYINSCDKGFLCANPGLGMECDPMANGCCLPFCDTSVMPPMCPGVGQECLPWYEMGMAPPGYETVGICGLPM